ncbi:response regulator [Sphingomonadaceae bacterium jetA1]|uniref:response regulator n=1 Tax=Facivitalis istanbulensis TaxID=3075838 RepID=UPI00346E5428
MNRKAAGLRRALLVEDDAGVRRSLQLLLHWRGFDVRSHAGAASLLASDDAAAADILIADYRLPDGNGVDLLHRLIERGWSGRSILITAYADAALRQAAQDGGFHTVLEKPLRPQVLIAALAGTV